MPGISTDIQRNDSRIKRLKAFEHTKVYDLLAALPLIIWYGFCVSARLPALVQKIAVTDFAAIDLRTISDLISKITTLIFFSSLITLLIFRDKPQAKAEGLMPRAAAIAGMYLIVGIVVLPPVELSNQLYFTSTLLVVIGTIFALYSALNLGQSISMMSEARRLVVGGPYAMIRHPLYLGEATVLVGLTLQFFSLSAVLILMLQCACQVIRMNNEEQVLLRTFPQYRNYMSQTARLIPYIY
jgi:protein-S-isoprenylcysteine O-methyltransferase Ste14